MYTTYIPIYYARAVDRPPAGRASGFGGHPQPLFGSTLLESVPRSGRLSWRVFLGREYSPGECSCSSVGNIILESVPVRPLLEKMGNIACLATQTLTDLGKRHHTML